MKLSLLIIGLALVALPAPPQANAATAAKPSTQSAANPSKRLGVDAKAVGNANIDDELSYTHAPYAHMMDVVNEECGTLAAVEAAICVKAPRIWWQYGIAAAVTGADADGKRVGRKIHIAVSGPSPYLGKDEKGPIIKDVYEQQAFILRGMIVNELVGMLDRTVPRPADLIDKELAKKASLADGSLAVQRQVAEQVAKVLQAQSSRFHAYLDPMLKEKGLNPLDFDLVVFDLPCYEAKGCPMAGDIKGVKEHAFHRYSKLREWARANNALTPNAAFRLREGKLDEPFQVLAYPSLRAGAHPWPKDLDSKEVVTKFETLVNFRRKNGRSINYAAIEATKLHPRSVLAIADLLDSPALAAKYAASSGASLAVSDEFARVRLLECSRLRGALTPAEVESCSGYKVDSIMLSQCANKGLCSPEPISDPSKSMVADLLFITHPERISMIAGENLFPRQVLGSDSAVVLTMQECHEKNNDPTEWARCTSYKRTDEKGRKVLDCIKTAGTDKALIQQCAEISMNALDRKRVDCAQEAGTNAAKLVACSTDASIPPEVHSILKCGSSFAGTANADTAIRNCLGHDVAMAKECVDKLNRKDGWIDAMSCAAEGQKIPPEAAALMQCYQTTPQRDLASVSACLASKTVGGDAGRLLKCAIESGYDAWGTTICMAAGNFTPDQRIFLQCAMQTSGEPLSTATCTMGKLAMKELNNCSGKKFGEDKCFGENNDFRKFARTLGGEIGPKSVVADIINFQMRVLEVSGGIKVLSETEKAFNASVSEIVQAHLSVIDSISKGKLSDVPGKYANVVCRSLTGGLMGC